MMTVMTTTEENKTVVQEFISFSALADSTDPVASLDQATRCDRGASPRYRNLMAALGLGDEARAVLRSHGRCWGVFYAARGRPSPPSALSGSASFCHSQ
jgi:hypothetical protein